MSKNVILQEQFLNKLRKEKVLVSVFLVSGIKLVGEVVAFDQFVIILSNNGQTQMIYKHAVSTIVPSRPVPLFESDDQDGE